ncbi:MAG: hypothetical protein M3014_13400 [Chloroflexota bacterium]|nr:hypothetical protein [Chloroflexota bacterium]
MTKRERIFCQTGVFILSLAVVVPFQFAAQQSAQAQQGPCRTFSETGKAVCGRFLSYWQDHGGLMQQGFPLTGEFQEKSEVNDKIYTVQYFERAVFELHPENAAPNDVLLSLLGTQALKQKYPNGAPELPAPANPLPGLSFPQTGKEIRGDFMTYWQTHGGLAQQGYPITNLVQEKSDLDGKLYTVQYFERAVFEMHPENKPPYNVLLSQLGRLQMMRKYPNGFGGSSPTPAASATPTGQPATYPQYGHASDYSWLAGQLSQEGSCWVVTYVSPLVDIPADQYQNRLALSPGTAWSASALKSGEWVVAQGKPEPGTANMAGCPAHGYTVTSLRQNTSPPGGYPRFGHAPDFSWIAGQVSFTKIQGGCPFIRYDAAGTSVQPIGQGWSDASSHLTQGAYVVAFGRMAGPNDVVPVCPAKGYMVERIEANPAP